VIMAMDETWAVWWGCLQCYNEGNLEGDWIELAKDGDRNSWGATLNEYEKKHQALKYAIDGGYWGIHEEWMALDNGVGVNSEWIHEIYEVLETRQQEMVS
jgi:hypothetical protein